MRRLISLFILLCCCGTIFAQQITIKGTVLSATDNEALIGVNVSVDKDQIGTITDIDGNFTLTANSDAVLIFSYIGYDTKQVPVNGQSHMIVKLDEASMLLDEVVAVGYRTERKADLTGAVSVVKVDDAMKAAENNPIKALQGRVAGMSITSDGSPSGSATVRIRGIGTLNNNDPLYIIDGVPTTSGMHELNGNDIESIQVLRDASAASIYGSRAANGVIIITTKKGKKGTIKLNFDAYLTASMYTSKIDVLSSNEYAQVLWKSMINNNEDPNSNNLGLFYDYSTNESGHSILNQVYFPEYLDAARTMKPANTNWFDEVTRTGIAQSYNLSVSNGTEKGNYYFSLGYYNNDGLVKNTDFNRVSARVNSDFKLWDGIITIGENLTLNRTSEVVQPFQIVESALIAVPFIPVHTVDGTGWGGPITGLPDRRNPANLVDENKDNRYTYWRIFGNAFVDINPIKDLHIRSNFGLDYGNYYKRSLTYSFQNGYVTNSGKTKSVMEQAHWTKWTWSNIATYDFSFGENRFETMLGMEMYKQEDINFASSRESYSFENPNYMYPDQGTGTSEGSGSATGYTLMSFFGKVSYSYADKYLASVTLRRDGSSRFGKNNRWGTFPAFNLGWKINQEHFMENTQDWLSDLKIRFGWGQNGNQEIGNTAIYSIYATDYGKGDPTWNAIWGTAYDIYGNGSGLLPSGYKRVQLANPDLKWETTTQTNIGLDFGFFNQALYGSAEYYIKETKDILYTPGYSAIKGEGASKTYNGASMENKGFELTLGYRGNTNNNLQYDFTANISTNKNKVTYLPESVKNSYGGNGTYDNILGRPLGSFYGYVADGIFKTQEDLDNHCIQDGKDFGRIRYRDLNNDGVIDDKDRTWIGNPFPDFTYGLNINLAYKNIDLNIYFQGVHNIDVYNNVKLTSDFWSVSDTRSNKTSRLLDAWDPISNPNSNIPALTTNNKNDEGRMSTYFIENGSYFKLRNIQIGYTLPSIAVKAMRMEKIRFYLSGQNLFTIKSKSFTGVDPENPGWGYPIPTTLTFGLNATF